MATRSEPVEALAVSTAQPTFSEVYERSFARVHAYVRYRVADEEAAEDLTARVFERALDRLGTYRAERGPLLPWVLAIARNTVNSHHRRAALLRFLPLARPDDLPSPLPTPEEQVIAGEAQAALRVGLTRLSARERDVLALKFGSGITNREIARLMGLGESNVAVIIYRTVRRLRELLADGEGER